MAGGPDVLPDENTRFLAEVDRDADAIANLIYSSAEDMVRRHPKENRVISALEEQALCLDLYRGLRVLETRKDFEGRGKTQMDYIFQYLLTDAQRAEMGSENLERVRIGYNGAVKKLFKQES